MYEEGSKEHKDVIAYLDLNPYFSVKEFQCKCKKCSERSGGPLMLMNLPFLKKLTKIRKALGVPLLVSSGYRCNDHPEEEKKAEAFRKFHVEGIAADIEVRSKVHRARVVREAHINGLLGVGLANNFVHLDDREWDALYTYPKTR